MCGFLRKATGSFSEKPSALPGGALGRGIGEFFNLADGRGSEPLDLGRPDILSCKTARCRIVKAGFRGTDLFRPAAQAGRERGAHMKTIWCGGRHGKRLEAASILGRLLRGRGLSCAPSLRPTGCDPSSGDLCLDVEEHCKFPSKDQEKIGTAVRTSRFSG